MAWTTDNLVERAKSKAQWPDSGKLTDAQILAVADEELQGSVVPEVRGASAGFWLKEVAIAIVAGQARYEIPARTSAGSTYELVRVDAQGNGLPMTQVDRSMRYSLGFSNGATQGIPAAYAIEDNSIVLFPTPSTSSAPSYSLLLRYERRPSQLAFTADCARICTVGATYVKSQTRLTGRTFDVAKAAPQFTAIVDDATTTVAGAGPYQYTFTGVAAADIARISVGDWVCPQNTTCIVPVPDIWFWLLVARVAAEMLVRSGDMENAIAIKTEIAEKLPKALEMAGRRTKTFGAPIMNLNSPLRSSGRFYGGWGR